MKVPFCGVDCFLAFKEATRKRGLLDLLWLAEMDVAVCCFEVLVCYTSQGSSSWPEFKCRIMGYGMFLTCVGGAFRKWQSSICLAQFVREDTAICCPIILCVAHAYSVTKVRVCLFIHANTQPDLGTGYTPARLRSASCGCQRPQRWYEVHVPPYGECQRYELSVCAVVSASAIIIHPR